MPRQPNTTTKRKRKPEAEPAAAELVTITETVPDCIAGLHAVHGVLEKKTATFHIDTLYDRVTVGAWLLKARTLYMLPNEGQRGGGWNKRKARIRGVGLTNEKNSSCTSNVGSARLETSNLLDGQPVPKDFLSFLDWCADSLRLKRSTAYNYIAAAEGAGLRPEDDPVAAVQALRRKKALHGQSMKALQSKAKAEDEETDDSSDDEGGEEETPRSSSSLIRESLCSLRETADDLVKLRSEMSPKALETTCARLHRTLCELTGQTWRPADDKDPDHLLAHFEEHGDVYELGN